MARLPVQDDKGGYTRDRFVADLEAPMGEERAAPRSQRRRADDDSGVASLMQFTM